MEFVVIDIKKINFQVKVREEKKTQRILKLDGVGPVDNSPPRTSSTILSKKITWWPPRSDFFCYDTFHQLLHSGCSLK